MVETHYMPLFINLTDRNVTIFGGGKVGERKAALFSKYANVRVVSREFTPKIKELASNGEIELIPSKNILEDVDLLLQDTYIAIICTNDREVNSKLEQRFKDCGALLNVVDVPNPGDIIVPSISANDGLYIAVSTQGTAPLISRQLRKRIEDLIQDEHWLEWLDVVASARIKVQKTIHNPMDRKKILYKIFEDKLINELINSDNFESAKQRSLDILLEYSKIR